MKNKNFKRSTCAFLVASTALTSSAFAATLGSEIDGYDVEVRGGVDLIQNTYWTGSDYRSENYIEYSPNSQIYPVVVYGSKLTNYGSFADMATLLNEQGMYVVGGINGGYFNTWDYQPLGLVISNGELISSDGGMVAVGFKSDGSAVIGKPSMTINANIGGETYTIEGINKDRGAGYMLYSSEYAHVTKNTKDGTDVILTLPEDEYIKMNGEFEFTVEEVIKNEDGAQEIPEGKYVLSLPMTADEWHQNGINSLEAGDTLTVTIGSDEAWNEVEYGLGTIYHLLSDGNIVGDFEVGNAPRTAVGVKEDGTVIFYTIDGRKSGHSVGTNMQGVAERLLELGCTDAILMDGGGSTAMNMVHPGDASLSLINVPSDGKQRSVTDYIMLVSTVEPSGMTDKLVLSPYDANMLVGAELELTVKAQDATGFKSQIPTDLDFSVENDLGTVEDGVFTAEMAGSGKIFVGSDDLNEGEMNVDIIETPDYMAVMKENGSTISSLKLDSGDTVDLTAYSSHNYLSLIDSDLCYTWEVTGDIGTIDENGFFTASEEFAEGTIEVSAGEKTISIPVSVSYPLGVYEDVSEDDWYYESVKIVGEMEILNGVTNTIFAPHENMTRAMFVTVLHRMEGMPESDNILTFEDVEPDMWYTEAVKWANEKGLVMGYDEKTFGINDLINREQMATLLLRYATFKGETLDLDEDLSIFSDYEEISEYAVDSVKWAVGLGLMNGMTEDTFEPFGTAIRAQTAVILDRYMHPSEEEPSETTEPTETEVEEETPSENPEELPVENPEAQPPENSDELPEENTADVAE